MNTIKKYLSMVKFAHSIFAMPFAFIGFFLAIKLNDLSFDYIKLIYIVFAMIFARNAAMGFNRYLDRDIDKRNERTKSREVAAGIITPKNAVIFVIINSLLFMATAWLINWLAFFLSPVALAVVLGYSYTKRFTALCHLVLGLGLSLAPIGAYISVTGSFNNAIPILISFVVLFWTAGFDIIYALQDEEFDKENHLKSIPSRIGKEKSLRLSEVFHIVSAILVIEAGYLLDTGFWYWIAAGLFIGLLYNQHRLVKPNDLSKVNLAFFTTNGFASILFAIFTILSLYIH
ncbi:MAG TPA: 4-hydroxybenzoate octaprenyltransferase [Saprospiraceae bacterium]|jgi:4-hydroxybenzoate polyprenyltransferase|nr:4-hydroxybenzoate octaprenyltransferase [Saprospiraceae bacterium]